MTGITKRFRWGDSVNDNLYLFTTGELRAVKQRSRALIVDFADLEEGYCCARFAFEMFERTFRLEYQDEAGEWVLEVELDPDEGGPGPSGARRMRAAAAGPAHSPRRRRGGSAPRTELGLYSNRNLALALGEAVRRCRQGLYIRPVAPSASALALQSATTSSRRRPMVELPRLGVDGPLAIAGQMSGRVRTACDEERLWSLAPPCALPEQSSG